MVFWSLKLVSIYYGLQAILAHYGQSSAHHQQKKNHNSNEFEIST
jgi:hypothetical protein